jgi:addiction module RelE/StbE family toxin
MRIRYTPRAQADLDSIFSYLDERSPAAAVHVKRVIQHLVAGLVDFPGVGSSTDVRGVRALLAGRFPYLIFYRIAGAEIQVLHVRHTGREPWRGE